MQSILDQINKTKIPEHLAIIMDGNGRWAKSRGFLRSIGHKNGIKPVREALKACDELGIKYLTLYAFSTENWNRPALEVNTLMGLLVKTLASELSSFMENNVRLKIIGDYKKFPAKVVNSLDEVIEKTQGNTKSVLTLALNYGAKEEIIRAAQELAIQVKEDKIQAEDIDQDTFNQALYTPDLPEVDLLIRTSGEQRISNFMLWQIAYAELYFTDILWPDIMKEDIYCAILNYQKRERRFGKTSEQLQ